MPSLSIYLPQIETHDLVFNDQETREILSFFWPKQAGGFLHIEITSTLREFAQGLLIVAIDASYAMGYIEVLVNVLVKRKPGSSITSLVTKLIKKDVKHWWKHVGQRDLKRAKIYETVRVAIAEKQRTILDMHLNGLAQNLIPSNNTLVLSKSISTTVWV